MKKLAFETNLAGKKKPPMHPKHQSNTKAKVPSANQQQADFVKSYDYFKELFRSQSQEVLVKPTEMKVMASEKSIELIDNPPKSLHVIDTDKIDSPLMSPHVIDRDNVPHRKRD